jgi:hypothetical protein
MKMRWLVLPILVLGFLLFIHFVLSEHISPDESLKGEIFVIFISLMFIQEQSERRVMERLDRIEAQMRPKGGNEV